MKLIDLLDGHISDIVTVANELDVDRENMAKFVKLGHQIMAINALREEVAKRSAFRINGSLLG